MLPRQTLTGLLCPSSRQQVGRPTRSGQRIGPVRQFALTATNLAWTWS